MLPNPGPGRLVAFEGLDGAGTTTQVRLLAERLRHNRTVFVTHEPSDGPVGLQIRMVLEHRLKVDSATLAAFFAADRMDHLYHNTAEEHQAEQGIVAHLRSGSDVLTDRYYVSSFAYQGLSLDWDWLWHMHQHCLRPDLTIFLDVPVEVCLRRIAAARGEHFELFENQKALSQIRDSYLCAIERLRQSGDKIAIIDGDASLDQVASAVWQEIQCLD